MFFHFSILLNSVHTLLFGWMGGALLAGAYQLQVGVSGQWALCRRNCTIRDESKCINVNNTSIEQTVQTITANINVKEGQTHTR